MPSPSESQTLKIKTLTPDSFEDRQVRDSHPTTSRSLPVRPTGRKRRRTVLSCSRCHRSKVSCDRQKPCSRCKQTGRADSCQYDSTPPQSSPGDETSLRTTGATPEEGPEPMDTGRPDAVFTYCNGRVRHGGRSHYGLLLKESADLLPVGWSSREEDRTIKRRLKELKMRFPPKRFHNYPFGNGTTVLAGPTQLNLLEFLPDPDKVRFLLQTYFRTFHVIYPVEHEKSFLERYDRFMANGETVGDDWLSQLFIMLALGAFASNDMECVPPSCRTRRLYYLLQGAQEALQRTPFMLKPTLTTVRTLTLVAVAKVLDMVSHNDSDTLWNFMGFVQRTAMGLSLHRDPEPLEGMSPFEKEMRRRLWATIVFLDLHVAIGSGMPTLIRPQDYSTRPPANIDEDQLSVDMVHTPQGAFPEHTTSTFQTRLAEILPDICAIISNINSAAPDLKYKDVLEFDAKLRQSLKASLACVSSRRNPVIGPKSLDRPHIQSSMLQLFVRGVMLALHCHYFMDPEKHPDYQTSYWAVLDCSLAILGQQRQIYDANSSELPTTWFNDINQGSYFIAAAHVTLGIKHGSFLSGPMALIGSSANETAWMLMDSLASISEEDVGRSVEYFKRYSAFYQRYATLQALVNGGDTEQARNDAFEHIIKVVSEKAAELYPSPFYG